MNKGITTCLLISLIFGYMKLLDPGSVVREGEFATAENTTGISGRVMRLYNNALRGDRLNPAQRAEFRAEAKGQYLQAEQQHRKLIKETTKKAELEGVDPRLVVTDMGLDVSTNQEDEIRVREKSSGDTGNLPANEFDPNLYERI